MKLWLPYTLVDRLEREVKQKLPNETGGVLMGYISSGDYVVTHLIGPGPDAIHAPHKFVPGHEYQCSEIAKQYNVTGGTETYLGDWHSHPYASAYLSKQDKASLHQIATFAEAKIPEPIMLVFGTDPDEIKCWRYIQKNRRELLELHYYNL